MLDGVVIDDAGVFNERVREWENFYNFNRPHGGLGGQTLNERLRLKTGNGIVRPWPAAQKKERLRPCVILRPPEAFSPELWAEGPPKRILRPRLGRLCSGRSPG